MTVEIDAGGETRSASSVIEIDATRQPMLLPEIGPYAVSIRGQAVFVALPDGKNIVALLTAGPTGMQAGFPTHVIFTAFKPAKGSPPLRNYDQFPQLRGRRELTLDQMPTFITVADPTDARTVRVINADNVEEGLGRVRSVSIEMTDDAVSPFDIEAHLPFLIKTCSSKMNITNPRVFTPVCPYFIRS